MGDNRDQLLSKSPNELKDNSNATGKSMQKPSKYMSLTWIKALRSSMTWSEVLPINFHVSVATFSQGAGSDTSFLPENSRLSCCWSVTNSLYRRSTSQICASLPCTRIWYNVKSCMPTTNQSPIEPPPFCWWDPITSTFRISTSWWLQDGEEDGSFDCNFVTSIDAEAVEVSSWSTWLIETSCGFCEKWGSQCTSNPSRSRRTLSISKIVST